LNKDAAQSTAFLRTQHGALAKACEVQVPVRGVAAPTGSCLQAEYASAVSPDDADDEYVCAKLCGAELTRASLSDSTARFQLWHRAVRACEGAGAG